MKLPRLSASSSSPSLDVFVSPKASVLPTGLTLLDPACGSTGSLSAKMSDLPLEDPAYSACSGNSHQHVCCFAQMQLDGLMPLALRGS